MTKAAAQLFAVPLDRFVETRTRLAAELAKAGKKEESRALTKVRRPSVSAWATNQVVQKARPHVDGLLEASDRLRQSQKAMLAGRSDRAKYQAGVDDLRRATAALAKAAREVLSGDGREADRHLIEKVVSNVRSAALNDERRDELLAAELVRDIDTGEETLTGLLGLAPASAGAPSAPAKARPTREAAPPPKAQPPKKPDEQARRREDERTRRLAAAQHDEAAANEVAARAETTVRHARSARERAREQDQQAQRAAAEARQALKEAETTLRGAERAATQADTRARAATGRRKTLER